MIHYRNKNNNDHIAHRLETASVSKLTQDFPAFTGNNTHSYCPL